MLSTSPQPPGSALPHRPAARTYDDLPGPAPLPVFGNMHQMKVYHLAAESWAREYGPMCRWRLGKRRVLGVADYDTIEFMLKHRPEFIRRSSLMDRLMTELGITGVFNAEGESWRMQRKLVMRAMTPEVVKNFFPTLATIALRLSSRWRSAIRSGRQIDLLSDIKAATLDVTLGLAMGQDSNTLEHPEFPLQADIALIFGTMARRVLIPYPYWHHVRLPPDRRAQASLARTRQAIQGYIDASRSRLRSHPELVHKPSNMLEAMVAARDEPGSAFTDEHLIGNAITMVFAGEDTTANSISWALYHLSRHPEAASRAARETDDLLRGAPALQAFSELDRLPWLDAVIKESMRLTPAAPLIALESTQDVVLNEVLIPRGIGIVAMTRLAAHARLKLQDEQDFRPARWLEGHADFSDQTRHLLTFGAGPRFCPGRYLAHAELLVFLSTILRHFVLQADAHAASVTETFRFTVGPSALPLRLIAR